MSKSALRQRWQNADFMLTAGRLVEEAMVNKHETCGADFRGLIVGLEGANPSLLYADFQETSLIDVDLGFAKMSCSFNRCRFQAVQLDEALFDTCLYRNSHFERCSFFKARLESPSLDDAEFTDCVFDESRLHGRGRNEYGGKRITFIRCRFAGASFRNLQLRGSTFIDCDFTAATFRNCILSGVTFEGSCPSRHAFSDSELSKCVVNGAPFSSE